MNIDDIDIISCRWDSSIFKSGNNNLDIDGLFEGVRN